MQYKNVPFTVGVLLSEKMATLHELDTVYGMEDLYNMLEVVLVDAYNVKLAREKA